MDNGHIRVYLHSAKRENPIQCFGDKINKPLNITFIGRLLLAEPLNSDYTMNGLQMEAEPGLSDNQPDIDTSPPQGPPQGSPQGIARLFYLPRLGLAAIIVLLFCVLIMVYVYTFLGHIMIINIPPPDPLPQWVLDLSRESGIPFPTPSPSPDHLMMADVIGQNERLSAYLSIIFVTALICWPIIALGLHLIARLAGGKGTFVEMAAAIGYTYIPKVIGMVLVVLVVAMLPVYQIDMVNYHDSSDLLRYIDSSSIHFLMIAGITKVGLVLSCCLGVVAVKQVEKVNWLTAVLIVGIPLVLYLFL